MADFVELGAEGINHLTEHPVFDKGYDKVAHAVRKRRGKEDPSPDAEPYRRQSGDDTASYRAAPLAPAAASSVAGSSRKQRNTLPDPEPADDIDRRSTYSARPARQRDIDVESEISDRYTRRQYERELDDPVRKPESVLPRKELRRDSRMASQYGDGYTQSAYRSRSSQPPRSKAYDDDDSDYDERSGRRYGRGNGRGYDDRDDRDYDIVREETERYRGPVSAGPLVPVDRPWDANRRESVRSGYGEGAVAPYGRRSGEDLRDDDRRTTVSRRSKSRGRDYDRDRSYSRSRSGSREGVKEKIGEHFDTSARGLGVGLAGAVVGGLAGRQFGHKHKQRDIVLGAVIGGLGANLAENKYHHWKEDKRDKLDREEDRWEQRWDGRSRSNVR